MPPQSQTMGTSLEELTDEQGKKLRDIAITSIRSRLSGMRYRPRISDIKLKDRAGVFVTLERDSELRGCIGYVFPTYEMWDATRKAAVQAAFSDPRFKPIERAELPFLDIEISVLGPLEKMKTLNNRELESLKLGRDGLMVVGQGSSGLLLPQVAIEFGFTPMEFLEAACEKAGLSYDAWQEESLSVYRFTARIFR